MDDVIIQSRQTLKKFYLTVKSSKSKNRAVVLISFLWKKKCVLLLKSN